MLVRTPFGTLRLARNDAKRFHKTVMELQRTTDSLTRKDIGDWRIAGQMAINVDNPNRQRLYDIYRDVEVDLHLSGCIQQREGFVLSRSFKLVNEKAMRTRRPRTISIRHGSSSSCSSHWIPTTGDTRSSNWVS